MDRGLAYLLNLVCASWVLSGASFGKNSKKKEKVDPLIFEENHIQSLEIVYDDLEAL